MLRSLMNQKRLFGYLVINGDDETMEKFHSSLSLTLLLIWFSEAALDAFVFDTWNLRMLQSTFFCVLLSIWCRLLGLKS